MAILINQNIAHTLDEIIKKHNKNKYDFIEIRSIYFDKKTYEETDMLVGMCSYKNGELVSLDGDTYYLNDIYFDDKETTDNNKVILTVWEYSVLENI